MNPWSLWIISGLLLFIAEIFVPGFVIASLGFGALTAGVGASLDASFKLQLLLFCIGTMVALFAFRPFMLKWEKRSGGLKTGVDALIGRDALVIQDINGSQGAGRVKIGGEEWMAVTENGKKEIAVGTKVSVLRIEGVKVIVTEIKNEEQM